MADNIIDAIDISFYQRKINFVQLSTARVQGRELSRAIVRAGQGTWPDKLYGRNWEGLRGIGWRLGTYFVCDPNSSGISQARFYWGIIKHDVGEYRPVADLELPKRPTQADRVNNWAFVAELTQLAGYPCTIYSRASWLNLIADDTNRSMHPYWGAGYPRLFIPHGWAKAAMHQYTDGGLVSGIDGRVDMNYVLDEAALLRPDVATPAPKEKPALPTQYPAAAVAPRGLVVRATNDDAGPVMMDISVKGVEVIVHEAPADGWAWVSLKDLRGLCRVDDLEFLKEDKKEGEKDKQ